MKRTKTCRTCLLEHDEEVHEATLRVREWFRGEVLLSLYAPEELLYPAVPEPEAEVEIELAS